MYAEKTGMINLDELEVKADEVTVVSGGYCTCTRNSACCVYTARGVCGF